MEAAAYIGSAFWGGEWCEGFGRTPVLPPHVVERLPAGAVVFQSSGSSGVEKWIVHSRQSLLASARMTNSYLQVHPEDVFGLLLPLYHVGGFGLVARAYASGGKLVQSSERWQASAAAQFLREQEVSITSLVPTQVYDLVEAGIAAPFTLRAVVVGGGRLERALGHAARELGWPVLQSYGMTEAGSQIATAGLEQLNEDFRNDDLPIIPGWKVETMAAASDGAGRFCISGPALAWGVITHENEGMAYHPLSSPYVTSDMGVIRDGRISVTGRTDRMVKINGELVDLTAWEEALVKKLGWAVVLLPVQDSRAGAGVAVITEGRALQLSVKSLLPPYVPMSSYHEVEALPRSALGKLDRRAARALITP